MPMLVLDEQIQASIVAERQATDDRWDEVWEGVYVVPPLPNDEHQEIGHLLGFAFQDSLGRDSLAKIRPGVNVSDRDEGWKQNYRCPDVVVFLPGTSAVNRDSHWVGGPDFAVEIVSQGDKSRDKLDFYAKVNVRELLIVDRFPWSLELYRLGDGVLGLVGNSTTEKTDHLDSEVLGLSFRSMKGGDRPRIEVRAGDDRRWLA